ncbi:hypothetical protein RA28_14365 [Ruegeria sp. ANG-S4]|uniref:hypothetical protein n=1 Tax=Ruegeria sp. ANG-S4 TaxID=1577904 RepID=UPI00057C631F|nr:hypothetical protein [Ruegeria sp. ANG-S4]KIC44153.1 hypothetical protein RA28_14365 [Ruegeria sp. ANG-S4]
MKPAFALSFSENGISLHHQSDGDWYCLGTVPLDAPDLSEQIQALREQGFALANHLGCALVIPPDQVRLLTVDTQGLSPEDADTRIQTTLADATPYALADLAYSTVSAGTESNVAAVARQTLAEARAFAVSHGFIPETFRAGGEADSPVQGHLFEWPVDDAEPTSDARPTPDAEPSSDVDSSDDAEPVLVSDSVPSAEPELQIQDDLTQEDTAPEPVPADSPEDLEPSAEPEPPVHAIAGTSEPEKFRSTPIAAANAQRPARDIKRFAIPAVAASVFLGMALGAWSLMGPDDPPVDQEVTQASPEPEAVEPPQTEVAAAEPSEPAPEPLPDISEPEPSEGLSATDAAILEALSVEPQTAPENQDPSSETDPAILEALNMAPEPVEAISRDDAPQTVFSDFTGAAPTAPGVLIAPELDQTEDVYLASIDRSDLSVDALALPHADSLVTDQPFDQPASPSTQDQQFDLDDRGLVVATPEGALNPDGIMVYQGRPSSVPPEPPVRFEAEPEPVEPDERLSGFRPRPRPDNLVDQFERTQLGGRSRAELAVVRPKLRPASLKAEPEIDYTPTALAVVRVPRPKSRPAGLAPRTASASTANLGSTANVATPQNEPGSFTPKAVSPKIPTTASVARQATIDNAINLRRLNLIGVYGTPANRRALVRLPSGRYKKLKIGDRIDGGKVVAIGDSELRYQKRGKNVTLKMPRG